MSCGQCGNNRPIMVPMKPGKDGQEWELCSLCHKDGLTPFRVGNFKHASDEEPVEVSAEMAEALKKSGWKEAERSVAKQEVANFDRPKRGKRKSS